MAVQQIESFSQGIDRRRPRYAASSGSVWDAVNCHLTRGGDLEKRKAFVSKYTLPAGTFGLEGASQQLYVFGSIADPGVPAGVVYQRLETGIKTMTAILDTTVFDGKPYVVAQFDGADIHHFYNGTEVTDFAATADKPNVVYTYRTKVYGLNGSLLRFTAINDPTKWNSGTGYGFINLANHSAGSDNLVGLEVFQGNMAMFSRRAVQIWTLNEDPTKNVQQQVLRNTGTRVSGSVQAYGDVDVFYLDESGVRSVRARNVSNSGFVNDIGTPIDQYIRDYITSIPAATLEAGQACIEPTDGRYWLAIGTKIFVFSYFPSGKISAWTTYEPGFTTDKFAVIDDKVYARSGNTIYLYGGDNGTVYDNSRVTVRLPFMSGGKPSMNKQLRGIDIASSGTWEVNLLVDPRDETRMVRLGRLSGITYQDLFAMGSAYTPYLAPEFVSDDNTPCSLSYITMYFEGGSDN
jgi:hypothetical protein